MTLGGSSAVRAAASSMPSGRSSSSAQISSTIRAVAVWAASPAGPPGLAR